MNHMVIVYDKMQQWYTYELVAPMWQDFRDDFHPELTPKEMLEAGVFGGKYMTDCQEEFPKDWFENAKLSPLFYDVSCNFFGVRASQSLSIWQEKWWIYKDDPRGRFQWYCRYYMGRRIPDEDNRQIKRWKAMTRHLSALKNACTIPMDRSCRKKQRQALLHWAYDSRKI